MFDAHILSVPSMGIDPSMQWTEERKAMTRKISEIAPGMSLFFPPEPDKDDERLKVYFEDELESTGPLLAKTFVCTILDLPEHN